MLADRVGLGPPGSEAARSPAPSYLLRRASVAAAAAVIAGAASSKCPGGHCRSGLTCPDEEKVMPDRQEQAPRMDPGYHIVPRVAADLNGALEPTVPLGFSFTLLSLSVSVSLVFSPWFSVFRVLQHLPTLGKASGREIEKETSRRAIKIYLDTTFRPTSVKSCCYF